MNKALVKKAFLALTILFSANAFAQEMPQPLPIDPNVRYGKLDNGLTYYIRHNEQPKERCEFHIAQAVGAILEEDHQNGLAHFLEHMAFNGTTHFAGKGIISYFESVGVNFGGDINAYTSLDETVYRLSNVPTYREGILDSALLVLHDWSCDLLLLPEEIDNERGVIREEWRQGANATRRMWRQSNQLKYAGSQYAKRDVIGDTAVINNFSYQALRDYYEKWYGPDLQAIVIVGDIDVDKMEAKIKELWKDVPARANRGERPYYALGENAEPIIAIVTDKEAQNTRIDLEYKKAPLPAPFKGTIVDAMQQYAHQLLSSIMNYRFEEITTKAESPIMAALVTYGELVKNTDAYRMIGIAKEGQVEATLNTLFTEGEKLKRFGVTESEVERAKAEMLKFYENTYNERNNRQNITLTEEYIRHYLDGSFIPGIEMEYEIVKTLLPQLNAAMLTELAKTYVTDENLIISIQAPEKDRATLPSAETINNILQSAKNAEIEAPKEEKIDKTLIDKKPKQGKIKKTSYNAELNTTEWTLSNGVRVIIKPTTFKQDEILLNAHSWGGLSKVATQDLPSGGFAVNVVEQNGLGKFSVTDLQKVLAGKNIAITPQISELTEGFQGQSSVADFETLLQLVYLYFTDVRTDDEAFASLISMYHSMLVNQESNPKVAFRDSISLTMSNHSPRTLLWHANLLEKVNQATALRIFKERFGNAADFTFFLTGNIDPTNKETQKMVCQWLGGLKTKKKAHETFTDHGERIPKGIVKNYFERPMEIKTASNRIVYSVAIPYNLENRLIMNVISEILSTRYLESIREKEGGSYGVGVAGYIEKYPTEQAVLLMQFDTDPEKQEKLIGIIHKEIQEIIANGPKEEDLTKTKEILLKSFKENLESNADWSRTYLPRYYINNLNYVRDFQNIVENITSETVVNTLKSIVEQGNVIEVVMKPTK